MNKQVSQQEEVARGVVRGLVRFVGLVVFIAGAVIAGLFVIHHFGWIPEINL